MQWQHVKRGEEIATVMTFDRLLVKAAIQQRDVELVQESSAPRTEIRLAGSIAKRLIGTDPHILPGAQGQLATELAGHAGGGEIAVDPRDEQGRRPVTPQFELRVHLANPNGEFYPGQRAYVRLTVGHLPLLKQWTRRFLQLIDSSNTNEWL